VSIVNEGLDRHQKLLLNCALRTLLGASDLQTLATFFKERKRSQTTSKGSRPVEGALSLETTVLRFCECYCSIDPELSSLTVPGLISFIVKGQPLQA
jgi:hypothetical protein